MSEQSLSFFDRTYQALICASVSKKLAMATALYDNWQQLKGQEQAGWLKDEKAPQAIEHPGRPPKPVLVDPREVPRRRITTNKGLGALVHALAHIEFNAVDLALDAAYRFRGMPSAYYGDWLRIAAEEAYHFSLLQEYLQSLGYDYGDFEAHNALWEAAERTAHDVLIRMALVPRVMEARGLDAGPDIIAKFEAIGDNRAMEIMKIIMHDEIGHVKIGSHWFHYLCDQRGLPREQTFQQLMADYFRGKIKKPLCREARLQAGFSEAELLYLEGMEC